MKRQIRCTGWCLSRRVSLRHSSECIRKKWEESLSNSRAHIRACWATTWPSLLIMFSTWLHLKCLCLFQYFQINIRERESASKSREKSLFVQLVNKLLTNCCLSYFKLAGRRWVMQGAPCRLLLFTSSVPMFAPTSKLLAPSPSLCPSQSKSRFYIFIPFAHDTCFCRIFSWRIYRWHPLSDNQIYSKIQVILLFKCPNF